MKIINYNNIHNYKDIDIINIEKLLYGNSKYINDKLDFYYLLEFPIINLEKKKYNDDIFFYYLDSKKYDNIKIDIPELLITRIIYSKINNSSYFIINEEYKLSNSSHSLTLLINYTNNIINDFNIFKKIILNISNLKTNVKYFSSYDLIEMIDHLQKYLYYYNVFTKQLYIISNTFSNKNEINIKFINNINIIKNEYNLIYNLLKDNRHSVMQRISYLETGMSRLLTIIATIFLPLTFVVGFFSLPFKNIPFKKNKYGIYYICIILLTISFVIINSLFDDIYNNFFRFFN